MKKSSVSRSESIAVDKSLATFFVSFDNCVAIPEKKAC